MNNIKYYYGDYDNGGIRPGTEWYFNNEGKTFTNKVPENFKIEFDELKNKYNELLKEYSNLKNKFNSYELEILNAILAEDSEFLEKFNCFKEAFKLIIKSNVDLSSIDNNIINKCLDLLKLERNN